METTKKKRTNQKLSASYIFFKDSRSITQVIGYARLRKKKYFFCSTQTRVSHYTLRSTYKESSTTRTHLCTHKKIVLTLYYTQSSCWYQHSGSVRKKKMCISERFERKVKSTVCVCVCVRFQIGEDSISMKSRENTHTHTRLF